MSHLNSQCNTFCCHNIFHVRVTLPFLVRITECWYLNYKLFYEASTRGYTNSRDKMNLWYCTQLGSVQFKFHWRCFIMKLNKPICKLFSAASCLCFNRVCERIFQKEFAVQVNRLQHFHNFNQTLWKLTERSFSVTEVKYITNLFHNLLICW